MSLKLFHYDGKQVGTGFGVTPSICIRAESLAQAEELVRKLKQMGLNEQGLTFNGVLAPLKFRNARTAS